MFTGTIIGLLVALVLVCFTNSYTFHALVKNFNENCVSDATLAFRPILYKNQVENDRPQAYHNKRYEDENYAKKVDHYYDEFKTYHLQVVNATDDTTTAPTPKTKLFQLKSSTDGDLLTTTTERYGYGILKKKPIEMNQNDSLFFKSCKWLIINCF